MALLSQPNKPEVWILFQYHMQVNYIGLKIIHVKILPINAASMPEEGGNYWESTVSSKFPCLRFLVEVQLIWLNSFWAEGTEGQYTYAICFGNIRC